MKKYVHLIILAALLPLIGTAREETMEERKQRVTRKYLRERMNVAQSDMYVPEALEEDEQVSSSEQYKEIEDAFERQEPSPLPPPSARPRPVPQQDNSNWLLNDADIADDPFADPLDPYTSSESEYMSMWGGDAFREKDERSSRTEQRYNPYESRSGMLDPRSRERLDSRSSVMDGRTGIFGQRESSPATTGFGNQRSRTYGASPENGLLQQPFVRKEEAEPDRSRESQRYTPYKSPYEDDRNQRRLQGTTQEPQPEYTKPDAFKQWKERNQTWDPTGDDAYLDELMKRNSR